MKISSTKLVTWLIKYEGCNTLLNQCKRKLKSNHPLTLNEIECVRKFYIHKQND